jgi:hypothetical protein
VPRGKGCRFCHRAQNSRTRPRRPGLQSSTVARLRNFATVLGLSYPPTPGSVARAKLAIAVVLGVPRQRARTGGAALARSWRSRDELAPCCILPFLRKDRTIKPWDQTTTLCISSVHKYPRRRLPADMSEASGGSIWAKMNHRE